MKHLTATIEDKVAAEGEAFKQYVLKVYKTPWHTLSDETLRQALKDFKKGKIKHYLGKEPVRIAKLIKRYPEKETGYDKKFEKEYWEFEWSDGTKGEGSLYQSQIKSVKKFKHLGKGPSLTYPKADELLFNLKQFTGTMNYYQHPLSGYKYTDGVQYLAEKAEAYWLIDKILITTKHIPKLQLQEYQEFTNWKLIVNDDRTATLTAEDGNGYKIYSEKIDYTDFPLKEINLWFENGVLLLPSEH